MEQFAKIWPDFNGFDFPGFLSKMIVLLTKLSEPGARTFARFLRRPPTFLQITPALRKYPKSKSKIVETSCRFWKVVKFWLGPWVSSCASLRFIAKKEPDAFIMLRGGQFPLVVLEAGFSESESNLIQDAQLRLYGDCAAVKFVLIVTIMGDIGGRHVDWECLDVSHFSV